VPSPFRQGLGRCQAYAVNETMQILRDPLRLVFASLGTAILMLVCGFGISTDVEHVRYAALDLDRSPASRRYLEQFTSAHRYFTPTSPARSDQDALERLQSDDVSLVLEIPPSFGRDLRRGSEPEVLAQVDGAMILRGDTISGYVDEVHRETLLDPWSGLPTTHKPPQLPIQERYMYNPTFESIYSIVPNVPAILLLLFTSILMSIAIVREKELGSIVNFYVTPTGKLEYLLGKQLPYIVIGMINFFILAIMSLLIFNVPVKGSFLTLTLCTLVYMVVTTGLGMVTSTFTRSQMAAVIVTSILTIVPSVSFSGLMQPVSTLTGAAKLIGSTWPAAFYMDASLGAYTKGLGPRLLARDILSLACWIPLLLGASVIGLRKQEK
jgi:ribosome-dependent ATPase